MLNALRSHICLFCMKRAEKYSKLIAKEENDDIRMKYIKKTFWWLNRSIIFASKEQIQAFKQIWPTEEEIRNFA